MLFQIISPNTNDSLVKIRPMKQKSVNKETADPTGNSFPEMNLTDNDILDAMQHIPGYLDISTEDFRSIYHLAHRHALERLFATVTAGRLMRGEIKPLHPDTTLDKAARILADSGYKGLPVVNTDSHVIGMLTETDFLKHLQAENFMELLLKMFDDSYEFSHRCHETIVSAVMTKPTVTVRQNAKFSEILEAFSRHKGRSMPVIGADNRLLGLLLRKDFISVYKSMDPQ